MRPPKARRVPGLERARVERLAEARELGVVDVGEPEADGVGLVERGEEGLVGLRAGGARRPGMTTQAAETAPAASAASQSRRPTSANGSSTSAWKRSPGLTARQLTAFEAYTGIAVTARSLPREARAGRSARRTARPSAAACRRRRDRSRRRRAARPRARARARRGAAGASPRSGPAGATARTRGRARAAARRAGSLAARYAGQAERRAEVEERLVPVLRAARRGLDVGAAERALEHAPDVRVERGQLGAEGEAGDRARGVGPDAR